MFLSERQKSSNPAGFTSVVQNLTSFFRPKNAVCMLVTEQEDVEVWLDGRDTGLTTPCLLPARTDDTITVSLRKMGYESLDKELPIKSSASFVYESLKRVELKLVVSS